MISNKLIIKLQLAIIVIFAVIFLNSTSWSATYFVDATNGNDSNKGTSEAAPWKTISKVNSSHFRPGDFILFKRGEVWRETLLVPSSGTPGKPIVFSAYGSGNKPIISGADICTNWIAHDNHVYKTVAKANPYQVFFDGERGTKVNSIAKLNKANAWYWSNLRLYIYCTQNPVQQYTKQGVEASQRTYGMYADGKDYITVQDIHFAKPKWSGIFARNGSTNWTIQKVISECSYTHGIQFGSGDSERIIIDSSELCYNGGSGYNGNASHLKIRRNKIHDNCLLSEPNYPGHEWEGGVYVGTLNTEDVLVEYNHFYNNGRVSNHYISGPAIWFDGCNNPGGDTSFNSHVTPSIIRYNFIEGNRSGIKVECNSYTEVYYNIVINSLKDDTAIQHGQGIMVARYGHHVKIYNNVSYHNRINFGIVGTWPKEPANMTNNIIKNNISDNALERELLAINGGENDGVHGYGNVYGNNCFGTEHADFIEWGVKTYKSTYAAWEVAYGAKTHSVNAAPLFQGSENKNFRLMPVSPCIDAGTNVGLNYDYEEIAIPQGEQIDVGAFESRKFIKPPKRLKIADDAK